MRESERPGKENDVGPDVEHLGEVQAGNVVIFVSKDNAAVPDDEDAERCEKGEIWPERGEEVERRARCGYYDRYSGVKIVLEYISATLNMKGRIGEPSMLASSIIGSYIRPCTQPSKKTSLMLWFRLPL